MNRLFSSARPFANFPLNLTLNSSAINFQRALVKAAPDIRHTQKAIATL
jgi:hypothetical protein